LQLAAPRVDEASSEQEKRGAQRLSEQEASGEGQRTLSDEVRDFPSLSFDI
jgi:hypothetical protein